MPSKKLEDKIEDECVLYAQNQGWMSTKVSTRGWPDRVFVGPEGQTWWVEFKRPGFVPRPQQDGIHRRFAELDHTVDLVTDFDQFCRLLELRIHSVIDSEQESVLFEESLR